MTNKIPLIRVFLSSPGDVAAERKIAMDVIERLPNRPAFRDRVAFRIIAWDKVGAGIPMSAKLTPQDAINKGLPIPSECDLVVVLFWSRMGTPFIRIDGKEYMSGTHWELLDALNATRPEIFIYRRTEKKLFEATDTEGQEQYKKVEAFFKSDLFYKDGRIQRGLNTYLTPEEFREHFETHLETLVVNLLKKDLPTADSSKTPGIMVTSTPWAKEKSPFPGLRAFTEQDAEIFFGRGHEIDQLSQRVSTNPFTAVIGASGSGKSSLVGAGLIPRLRAEPAPKDWSMVQFTPSEDPFMALAAALIGNVSVLAGDPLDFARRVKDFAMQLFNQPDTLNITLKHTLKDIDVLLFIDQFEELFTLSKESTRLPFTALLKEATTAKNIRIVATLRADFYHRCLEFPDLTDLLNTNTFAK